MGTPATSADPGAPPRGNDLSRLLETEARLAAALETARAETTALVAAARDAALARESGLDAELAAAGDSLAASVGRDRDRRCAELAAAAGARIAAWDAIANEPATLRRLADAVIAALLGGEQG